MKELLRALKIVTISNPFFWIVVILCVIRSIYYQITITDKINSDYQIATGVIEEISGIRPHRYYYFIVNDIEYRGSTIYGGGLQVGDSIQIRYYVPDPNINEEEERFH